MADQYLKFNPNNCDARVTERWLHLIALTSEMDGEYNKLKPWAILAIC